MLAAAESYFEKVQALREKQFRYSPRDLRQLTSIQGWAGDASRTRSMQTKLETTLQPLAGKTLGARDWHTLLKGRCRWQ